MTVAFITGGLCLLYLVAYALMNAAAPVDEREQELDDEAQIAYLKSLED